MIDRKYRALASKEMRQSLEDALIGHEREHYKLSIDMKAAELGLLSSVAASRDRAGYRILELVPDLDMISAKIEVTNAELTSLKTDARS